MFTFIPPFVSSVRFSHLLTTITLLSFYLFFYFFPVLFHPPAYCCSFFLWEYPICYVLFICLLIITFLSIFKHLLFSFSPYPYTHTHNLCSYRLVCSDFCANETQHLETIVSLVVLIFRMFYKNLFLFNLKARALVIRFCLYIFTSLIKLLTLFYCFTLKL